MTKSNIKIKSNIYLLSDSDHPEKDAAFAAQIFSAAALESLKKRADESGGELELSDIQKRILNGETYIKLSEIRSVNTEQPKEQNDEQTEQTSEEAEELINEIGGEVSGEAVSEKMPSIEAVEHIETGQAEQAQEDDVPADMPSIDAVEHIGQPVQTAEDTEAEMPSIDAVEHIEHIEQTGQTEAEADIPSIQADEPLELDRLLKRGFGGEKTLIVCADGGYAKYVSFLLRKNRVANTLMKELASPAPVRHFADVLWDCNDKVIGRENFDKRFTARCSDEAARADECFDAFCGFAGSAPSEGLNLSALAEKIMRGDVPYSLFGGIDNITIAAADDAEPKNFDKVYVLENGYDDSSLIADNMGAERVAIADCPEVICGDNGSAVIIDSSGNPAVSVSGDDADSLSFIGGTVGDAVRKQAYISQNVKRGDEIRLELKDDVYEAIHNGMVIAKMSAAFSERVLGEFGGKRYFEQLPQSMGGLIVTNIITVVSCRGAAEFGEAVPPQFRERSFWLGVEISGFASEIT